MRKLANFLLLLLSQFAGGPGPIENNLVRFGLPALLWGLLWILAWSRQREQRDPRERMLLWGFGLGFAREFYMFLHMSTRIITGVGRETLCTYSEPVEHALGMAAVVVIAASFLRYLLDDDRAPRRYLQIGLGLTIIGLLITTWWWTNFLTLNPTVRFHQTWAGWYFHAVASVFLMIAFGILIRHKGWLSHVIVLALFFLFLGEIIVLLNFGTDRAHRQILCPLANTFHILAIPLFGYVYLQELAIARKKAERDLTAYRAHLEELVAARTEALTQSNNHLQQEIKERIKTEKALQQVSQRNRLILEAAGEGILGINHAGEHIFVNPAAARMLGYAPEELIGKPSHATWHYATEDGEVYPKTDCPIHVGYRDGVVCRGDDEVFWRKDGTCFHAAYVTTPIRQGNEIAGAVVIFQDITDRKRTEAEIQHRNAQLATQNAVTATLNQSLDLAPLLHNVLSTLLSSFEVPVGAVVLRDPATRQFTVTVVQAENTHDFFRRTLSHPPLAEDLFKIATASPTPKVIKKTTHKQLADVLSRGALHAFVGVPLTSKSEAVGTLILGIPRPKAFSPQEKALLTGLGQQIGVAIENSLLYKKTQQSAAKLTHLHEFSVSLHATLEPTMIYELVTEQAAQLLDCSIACLFHWNGDQLEICHPITYGITEEISRQTLCLSKEDFLGELLSRRTTLVISDTETQPAIPDVLREQLGARALLCLPLEKQGTLLGVLFLIDTAGPRAWTISEIAWAESFVNHVVIALENAQLHQTVERAAMLEERQRIAAAMHDGVAQTLSYLGLQCDALIESEKAGRHATLTTQCHALRDTVNQAVQEARHAIASLTHPPTRTSLQERLTALLDEFKRQQLNVTFNNKIKTPLVLPPETSEQIIKVIQEAITNAQKHAAASQVELQIMQKGELVAATVRDDGVGFDQTALNQDDRGHFGLSIMRARADRINGVLEIDSTPGHGTEVTLSWHHYGNEKMPCRDTAVAQWLTKGWEDGKDQRTARRRPRALS